MTHVRTTGPCALLDDCAATAAAPHSRLYTGFMHEHRCEDPATLEATVAAAEADLRAGLNAVVLADYEWGARLQGLATARPHALRLLMFSHLRRLSAEQADAWLAQAAADELEALDASLPAAGLLPFQPDTDGPAFDAAIAAIHGAIRAGETYQVNFTHRLQGASYGAPLQLYRRLRARQPVRYGAYLALPAGGDVTHVLSCSPELFLDHCGGQLTAQPMKGTAEGEHAAPWLQQDPKNRAENLMIVDLLRNDLGRVAVTGSVRVPALFALEQHGSVVQMTSTVTAQRRSDVDFAALLRATFPCGSITGAPKHQTMQWITRLEAQPRGLYSGAIGWLEAPAAGQVCGDFCLSVAIRTLTLGPAGADGLWPATLGVGGGIVLDSVAAQEHAETQLKARFATTLGHDFELFETLYAAPAQGAHQVRHLAQHLARLGGSARALGFAFDAEAAQHRVQQALAGLPPGPHRLRLGLRDDGTLVLASAPLPPLPPGPVALRLADAPLQPHALSRHKTTLRATYDAGVRQAEAEGAFDTLFFTADGRLVEGGRSSVFVRLPGDARWWTPPLADGALPGVMRAELLTSTSPGWTAGERTLWRDEVLAAAGLMVCNALRGALPAALHMARR